jgi:peptide/nickel transport system permease protein
MRRLAQVMCFALAVLAMATLSGLLGSEYATTDAQALQPSSWHAPFGSNVIGQDNFSRWLQALASMLSVVLPAGVLVAISGTALGVAMAATAQRAGWSAFDALARSAIEVLDGIPGIVVVLVLLAILPPTLMSIFLTFSVIFALPIARVVRAMALKFLADDFFNAARLSGASELLLLQSELWPVLKPSFWALLFLACGDCLRALVVLGFLGLGLQTTPTMGSVLAEATQLALMGKPLLLLASLLSTVLVLWVLQQQSADLTASVSKGQ